MKFLALLFSIFFCSYTFSQKYKDGIGLKFANLGFTQLDYKKFISTSNALELTAGGNTNYIWVQGNYLIQNKLNEDLDYYYGGGPGVGFVSGNPILGNSSSQRMMLGATAILGTEYTLPDLPFSFAAETGPYLQLLPNLKIAWYFGLSARYVLHE